MLFHFFFQILVSSKIHAEFFSKAFDLFLERGRSHLSSGRNLSSAALSISDSVTVLATNLPVSYWFAVLTESLRAIAAILPMPYGPEEKVLGLASLNISDKW